MMLPGPAGLIARTAMAAWAAAACLACWAAPGPPLSVDAQAGERIYRYGMLADQKALTGTRSDGVRTAGAAAACINCHRASGMGGAEGNQLIPPIAGAILGSPGDRPMRGRPRTSASLSRIGHPSLTRPAYTAESFAQAVVSGLRPSGERMSYLMPRYALDEQSLQQIRTYLDTLTVSEAPGIDDHALHLATVVTDDAPAAARDATLAIVSRCLNERSPQGSARGDGPRTWQHHVWRLGPDPARWQQELARLQQAQPVFAIVSGVSGGDWTTIHDYCEREGMPCILPNTAAVDTSRPSHWSFYFSGGVSLEAAVLGQYLADRAPPGGWRRIVQQIGNSELARLGASALMRRLQGQDIAIENRVHNAVRAKPATAALGRNDVLVLWLDPDELRAFTSQTMPPDAGVIAVSGTLGSLDDAPIAFAWRRQVAVMYLHESADRRASRVMLNAGNWMGRQGLAFDSGLLDIQGNTYSACEVTARALHVMRGRYSREYFLELVESADEAAVATAFPRFTLGPDRRHGSGGAYMMRYETPASTHLTPVGDWIVPQER